jgi:hypothetical protein
MSAVGFQVQAAVLRVQGSGFIGKGLGVRMYDVTCRFTSSGCSIKGSGFRV